MDIRRVSGLAAFGTVAILRYSKRSSVRHGILRPISARIAAHERTFLARNPPCRTVILLFGDLHFVPGSSRTRTRGVVGGAADEAALVACVDRVADRLTSVVLLGDVYDAYVEYRHLVPRGPARLLGQLARLGDSGVDVTYVVGNHDPWHRTFMEQELGFRLVREATTLAMDGVRLHVAHGDLVGRPRKSLAARIVRHPLSLALYTSLLPGDSGQALARRVSRLAGRREDDPGLPAVLREYADHALRGGAADVVAMGHSHETGSSVSWRAARRRFGPGGTMR
jgi:UDP-2,3-diacylglucosamine hydrolase